MIFFINVNKFSVQSRKLISRQKEEPSPLLFDYVFILTRFYRKIEVDIKYYDEFLTSA